MAKTTKSRKKKKVRPGVQNWTDIMDNLASNVDSFHNKLSVILGNTISKQQASQIRAAIESLKGWNDAAVEAIEINVEEIATDPKLVHKVLEAVHEDSECSFSLDSIEFMEYELKDHGYTFLKADSIVQEMRIEEFLQDLQDNPYQLRLIA